jgi:hypothetical protein
MAAREDREVTIGGRALSLSEYAEINAELSLAPQHSTAILANHLLNEPRWEAFDEAWEAKLSEALDTQSQEDAPPLLVTDYSEAFQRARARHAGAPLEFERFLALLGELRRGNSRPRALAQARVTLAQFLAAQSYWTRESMNDPALAARLFGRPV